MEKIFFNFGWEIRRNKDLLPDCLGVVADRLDSIVINRDMDLPLPRKKKVPTWAK